MIDSQWYLGVLGTNSNPEFQIVGISKQLIINPPENFDLFRSLDSDPEKYVGRKVIGFCKCIIELCDSSAFDNATYIIWNAQLSDFKEATEGGRVSTKSHVIQENVENKDFG